MSETDGNESADTGGVKRWEIPALDGSSGDGFLTASRLQELQKQAWDEAYEAGYKAGMQAGDEAVKERAARFDQLLIALAKPFDKLDETVEKQLVELAMTIVRQLFRREIKTEPTHVIGVVREAIQLLPVASRDIQVRLHPDDAAIVRESLSAAEGEQAWTIVEDPLIARGGCTVTSENSHIDAQAETRLNAIINAINGNDRK